MDGEIYGKEDKTDDGMIIFDFDFLFVYVDRICLPRTMKLTCDNVLYGLIKDNITLIMKKFCMMSPYIRPIIEAVAKVA